MVATEVRSELILVYAKTISSHLPSFSHVYDYSTRLYTSQTYLPDSRFPA